MIRFIYIIPIGGSQDPSEFISDRIRVGNIFNADRQKCILARSTSAGENFFEGYKNIDTYTDLDVGANKLFELQTDLTSPVKVLGLPVYGGDAGAAPHNILSATHTDTLTAAVVRGHIIVGNATPKWSALPIGAAGTVLRSNGTDPAWTTLAVAGIVAGSGVAGQVAFWDGANSIAGDAGLIYNSVTEYLNVNGRIGIGSLVAPTNALSVTGSSNITGQVGIDGAAPDNTVGLQVSSGNSTTRDKGIFVSGTYTGTTLATLYGIQSQNGINPGVGQGAITTCAGLFAEPITSQDRGTLTDFIGVLSAPRFTGNAVAPTNVINFSAKKGARAGATEPATNVGYRVEDISATGNTAVYGFYLPTAFANGTNKYGIAIASGMLNGFGTVTPTATVDIVGNALISTNLIVGATALIGTEILSVQKNQNAQTSLFIANTTSGTAAATFIGITNSATGSPGLYLYSMSAGFTTTNIFVANTAVIVSDKTGGLNVGTTSNTQFSLWSNNAKRMTVEATGKINIGHNTAKSGSNLDVLGISTVRAALGATFLSWVDTGTNAYRALMNLAGTTADYVFYTAQGTDGAETFQERFRVLNAGGQFGIGTGSPTAMLHIKAGTASASTAPLKFTSGTNLTTAEAGAMEYNGTNLFFTRTGTVREGVLTQSAVTTEAVVSDTTVTVNIGGTTYKLLARA